MTGKDSPLQNSAEVAIKRQHKVVEGIASVTAADNGLLQQHHLHRLQPVLEQLQWQKRAYPRGI